MPMASRDIVAAIGLLIFSGLYAWATFYIPDRTIPNTPGPSFFPFVIITLVAGLSVALLLKGIAERRTTGQMAITSSTARLPLLMLGAFGLFLAVLPWVGFLMASVAFFAVLMMLYGSRSPLKIVLWSLALPTALYVIFTEAFQVILPTGPLGF
jgi:putative tricarboxylic transport membrane protein